MPGSTDKNQQNGPQKAAPQTQESLVSTSPKPAQTCKTQKQKTARSKAGAVPGSTVWVGQKHLREPSKQKNSKNGCGNSLYGAYPRVIPGGYVKTKCITSAPTSLSPPINPPLARTEENIRDGFKAVLGSISAQPRPW